MEENCKEVAMELESLLNKVCDLSKTADDLGIGIDMFSCINGGVSFRLFFKEVVISNPSPFLTTASATGHTDAVKAEDFKWKS